MAHRISFAVITLTLFLFGRAFAGEKTISVAPDGSGDFKTVQEAIAAAPDHSAERTIIRIKPGTYAGPFHVPRSKPKVTLVGEDAESTILTWDRNFKMPLLTGETKYPNGLFIEGDDFVAQNLTVRNTAGDWGQALAARIVGDRAVIKNCRFTGWQDTLRVDDGRQYFRDCYIEGRVDFIYGSATAVFDRCHIHSKNGGYVTASRTPRDVPFGFVFLDCKLTGDDRPWNPATTNPSTTQPIAKASKLAYLGRPWRAYGAVAFVRCDLGDHIRPEGWDHWGNPENEKTARFSEYKSTGPGANSAARVKWSRQLTDEEAANYTVKNILAGKDKWDPTAD
jgi:pectinesterase